MSAFVTVDHVTKNFVPALSIGDRIAARFGAAIETRVVHAVDDASLHIAKGEVLGLVGEFWLWEVHAWSRHCRHLAADCGAG